MCFSSAVLDLWVFAAQQRWDMCGLFILPFHLCLEMQRSNGALHTRSCSVVHLFPLTEQPVAILSLYQAARQPRRAGCREHSSRSLKMRSLKMDIVLESSYFLIVLIWLCQLAIAISSWSVLDTFMEIILQSSTFKRDPVHALWDNPMSWTKVKQIRTIWRFVSKHCIRSQLKILTRTDSGTPRNEGFP